MKESPVTGSLLSYLDEGDVEFFLRRGTRRRLGASKAMMHEGDPTDHVLVLLSGWVRAYMNAKNGQVVLLALRGPGDVIGELAALRDAPRSTTVETLQQTEFVQFTHDAFLSCLHDRPSISIALARQLAERLLDSEAARFNFATMDVAGRVAALLVRHADLRGNRVPEGIMVRMPLTQQDIADTIGGSRRAVARAMQTFRDRGMLVTGRKSFVLRTPDVLRQLAGTVPNGAQ